MKNKNYGIVENEGDGECLFAVIRDGLKTTGKNVSVKEMRKILADNATQDMLEIYRTLFVNAQFQDIEIKTELKELTARNKTLKEKIKSTTDRTALAAIGRRSYSRYREVGAALGSGDAIVVGANDRFSVTFTAEGDLQSHSLELDYAGITAGT